MRVVVEKREDGLWNVRARPGRRDPGGKQAILGIKREDVEKAVTDVVAGVAEGAPRNVARPSATAG